MAGDAHLPSDDTPTRRSGPDEPPTVRGPAAGSLVLGRYVLEAVVGRGGMGVVWRAHDQTLGETVALKFLPEVVARDAVAIDELKEETRRARRLTHPHIVRIHDFLQDEQHAAVSMEYVAGRTLAQLRLEQPAKVFSPAALAPLVPQLCAALDYAHLQAKIVHRDLKPANLLVTPDGQLKVTDFGIARSLSETHTRLTGKGGGDSSGTLPYMSPQQIAGEKPAAADDIYALGATLYDLLTGKPPFHRGDAFSLMKQIAEKPPLSLAAQRTELGHPGEALPGAWEQTILACLAKSPAERPGSAGQVAARLGLGGPGDPDDRPTSRLTVAPAKSRRPLWAALAALGLAGLALGYYYGVAVPAQKQAEAQRQAEAEKSAERARATEQKKFADEEAEAQRRRGAGEAAAAAARTGPEEQAFAAIMQRIAATPDRAPPAQADATAGAVQAYLATAPERHRNEVATTWARRQAAMNDRSAGSARGSLIVRTTPAGAEVRVGALALDKSPLTLKEQQTGKYPVHARLAGYDDWNGEVEVKENEFAELDVPLVRSHGRLVIETEPAGQPYRLQGADANASGVADGQPRELPTGRYLLTILRGGAAEQAKYVEVRRDETTTERTFSPLAVTGLWKFSLTNRSPSAPATDIILKLERKNGSLAGSLSMPVRPGAPAGEMPLSTVAFKDDQLAFSIVHMLAGRRYETKYTARLRGDTLTGTAEYDTRDGQLRRYDWIAHRSH